MENIKINKNRLAREYDREIFSVAGVSSDLFTDHREVARELKGKNPYTITVIVDNLNPKFWNNKKYVEKTREPTISLYKELLYEYFFNELGQNQGNELYAKWLNKYRSEWKKNGGEKELD